MGEHRGLFASRRHCRRGLSVLIACTSSCESRRSSFSPFTTSMLEPRPEERACARLKGRPQARSCQRPSFETALRASSESDSILMAIVSGPCQTPRKHANAGKEDPRLGARDCFLEILGEPSASVEPSKRPFNHPTSRLGLERTDALRSRNDFNDPFAELGDRRGQLLPAVNTVSENVTQLWKQHPDIFQQR